MVAASAALMLIAVLVSATACDDAPVELPIEAPPEIGRAAVEEAPVHTHGSTTCAPAFGSGPWRWRGSVKLSSDGTQVVFSAGSDVYAVGADGTGLRKVGDASVGGKAGPKTSFDGSPDDQRMVYSACYPEQDRYEYELALVSLESGEPWKLTTNRVFDNYPAWSPDGERIAFLRNSVRGDDQANHLNLHTMASDGRGRRMEAEDAAHYPPQWSPDGQRIAFVRFEERYLTEPAIYTVEVGNGAPQRLTEAVSGPTWSPDGERIAFAKVFGDEVALFTIAADGTEARYLAAIEGWEAQFEYGREPDPAKAWIEVVSWSPDGSKILVLANEHSGGAQIAAVDGSATSSVTVRQPVVRSIEHAAWSPDGERIVMVGEFLGLGLESQPGAATARIAVLTMGVDGSAPRMLVGRQKDESLVGLGVVRGDISAEVAACGEGVAVPDPEANPGLVEDCEALLEVQNALAGSGELNWFADREIGEWEGVVVEGTPARVREVSLIRRGLVGEIPSELSELTELQVLNMSRNALMGEIPAELAELKNLERLILSYNYLSGEIPAELGGLSKLTGLGLDGNNLEGEIPAELVRLTSLRGLVLSYNRLTGKVPTELGGLSDLGYLNLSHNDLAGEIPAELGGLSELTHMHLSHNDLTGEVPVELGRLSELKELDLSRNELTGDVPEELGELKKLEKLDLFDNQLSGEIPAKLGGLVELKVLWLGSNNLGGEIPAALGRLTNLWELVLAGNRLTGCIPEGLSRIRYNDSDKLGLPDC